MAERAMVTGKGLQKENALAALAMKNQQEHARCRECVSSERQGATGDIVVGLGNSKQSWGW